ncbi:MAG: histidine phosphatase family protein [Bdellovibrionota bacterium]
MDLFLIRHGETAWNQEERCQGTSDIPLAERGRKQAHLLKEHLGNTAFDAVFSSDLSRAWETASILSDCPIEKIQTDPDLRELDQGLLEGKTWSELLRDHASLISEWLVRPADLRIPGGETIRECAKRAGSALQNIRESSNGKRVLVVSHNLAISSALAWIAGENLNSFRRFQQEPCALTRIDWTNEEMKFVRLNDFSFIPPALHTVRYGPHAAPAAAER